MLHVFWVCPWVISQLNIPRIPLVRGSQGLIIVLSGPGALGPANPPGLNSAHFCIVLITHGVNVVADWHIKSHLCTVKILCS